MNIDYLPSSSSIKISRPFTKATIARTGSITAIEIAMIAGGKMCLQQPLVIKCWRRLRLPDCFGAASHLHKHHRLFGTCFVPLVRKEAALT